MNRLLYLVPKCSDSLDLLREIYSSLGNNRGLKKTIFRAMKLQNKASDREEYIKTGFNYIEKRLGCAPMEVAHSILVETEKEFGSYEMIEYESFKKDIHMFIKDWGYCGKLLVKQFRRQRLKGIVAQIIFLIMNLNIYRMLHTDISMYVLVIVNTIGLMCFICLDYDSRIENAKSHEGNLARDFKDKKIALARTRKINSFYQLVGGLGLVVHIWYFVSLQLGQVI